MRKFVKITIDELKKKIDKAFSKNGWGYKTLTTKVESDLSKVDFDCENESIDTCYLDGFEHLIGYHSLDNGLSFLGVNGGGDWEYPLFYLIYWDGKALRGYIPKEGNSWNYHTHEAFGNDDEADVEFLGYDPLKRQAETGNGFTPSAQLVEADIRARIIWRNNESDKTISVKLS